MLLAGTGVAFAWVLLSVALGFSASQAHAEDDNGLLRTVTATVSDTASGVTGIVEDTASATVAPVAQTVAPVVQTVAAVAPIVPVAPVVDVVQSVATPVFTTVAEVTDWGVVA